MRTYKSVGEFVTPWGAQVVCVYRPETNDWNTATSCLVEDEYRIADLPDGGGDAIDIGGHIGGCTLALLSRGFRVTTVEPLPENMDMIAESVDLNGWTARWTPVYGAIAGVGGGRVRVGYGDRSTESGRHHEFIGMTEKIFSPSFADGCRTVEVNTVSVGGLVEMMDSRAGWVEAPLVPPYSDGRVAFLKIDTEGAEWDAFAGVSPHVLSKIDVIAAELHPISSTKNIRAEFGELLHGMFTDVTAEVYPYTAAYAANATTNAYYRLK